jgi:hypothetical protein
MPPRQSAFASSAMIHHYLIAQRDAENCHFYLSVELMNSSRDWSTSHLSMKFESVTAVGVDIS